MTDNITFIGPSRLSDTDELFFSEMFVTLQHADPLYKILIDKREDKVNCHITPSDSGYRKQIIDDLLHFNKLKTKFRIRFSSSLALSKKVSFTIS